MILSVYKDQLMVRPNARRRSLRDKFLLADSVLWDRVYSYTHREREREKEECMNT